MKMTKSLAVLAVLLQPVVAYAQGSPAPIGLWVGENSGDQIWVQSDGQCSAGGSVNIAGTCTWNPTYSGGVLTMTYQWTIGPAQLGWSIRWLNRNELLVNEVERFSRRG